MAIFLKSQKALERAGKLRSRRTEFWEGRGFGKGRVLERAGFWRGHEFSRAVPKPTKTWALAPEKPLLLPYRPDRFAFFLDAFFFDFPAQYATQSISISIPGECPRSLPTVVRTG